MFKLNWGVDFMKKSSLIIFVFSVLILMGCTNEVISQSPEKNRDVEYMNFEWTVDSIQDIDCSNHNCASRGMRYENLVVYQRSCEIHPNNWAPGFALYNLITGEDECIGQTIKDPTIYGDKIVYWDTSDWPNNVVKIYNIPTEEETILEGASGGGWGPKIYETYVFDGTNLFDITTGSIIEHNLPDCGDFYAFYNNKIVKSCLGFQGGIYVYDIETEELRHIATEFNEISGYVDIWNDFIFFTSNNQAYAYELGINQTVMISDNSNEYNTVEGIYNNMFYWNNGPQNSKVTTLRKEYINPSCGDTIIENTLLVEDLYCDYWEGINIGADDITLDCNGHTIAGDGHEQDYGIGISYMQGVTIKNCYVIDFMEGISLGSSSNNIIYDNVFSGNDAESNSCGICLSGSNNNLIYDNSASNNGAWGIKLQGGNSNNITDNEVNYNWHNGIWVLDSENNHITNNEVANTHFTGIRLTRGNNNIVSNNIISYSLDGIHIEVSSGNDISNNDISLSYGGGIYLESSATNNYIYGNSFIDNSINAYEEQDTTNNYWNNSNIGNHWSDFTDNIGFPNHYEISGEGTGIDYKPILGFCSDGTIVNQCSENQPWFCASISLDPIRIGLKYNCRECGCPSGEYCQSRTGMCKSLSTFPSP